MICAEDRQVPITSQMRHRDLNVDKLEIPLPTLPLIIAPLTCEGKSECIFSMLFFFELFVIFHGSPRLVSLGISGWVGMGKMEIAKKNNMVPIVLVTLQQIEK